MLTGPGGLTACSKFDVSSCWSQSIEAWSGTFDRRIVRTSFGDMTSRHDLAIELERNASTHPIESRQKHPGDVRVLKRLQELRAELRVQ